MEIDRRLTGGIFLLIGLAVAAGIVYVLFFYDFNKQPEPVRQPAIKEQPAKTGPAVPAKPAGEKKIIEIKPQIAPKEVGEEDLKQMAALFAERFGSYSNQSNYRNLRDLEIFMTVRMQAWAEEFIKLMIMRKEDTSIYYGITTRAISQKTVTFDAEAGTAKIMVGTQRRESLSTGANSAGFGQNLEIVFKKEGGIWKTDEANWQAK